MKKFIIVALCFALSGCGTLRDVFSREIAPRAADVVEKVCEESLADRRFVRDDINRELTERGTGHTWNGVTCAGDPAD